MIGNCMADDCNKVGNEVIPGIVLCRSHRKRTYYALCDIHHREVEERKLRDQAAKDLEALQVASSAAGWTSPPEVHVSRPRRRDAGRSSQPRKGPVSLTGLAPDWW
jgi:hypothetical protein